jgi:thioredoxin reductase (NADPH)
MQTVVIIGGGPAGCQCALWLTMLGHKVTVLEKSSQLGGLQAASPYPNNWVAGVMNLTGSEFAANLQRHIKDMNIPVLFNSDVTEIHTLPQGFTLHVNDNELPASHVVIATGVKPRCDELIAGENMLIGPGEKIYSYDFSNLRVAILGGGDNAAENYHFIKMKQAQVCHVYARTKRAREQLWSQVNSDEVFLQSYQVNQSAMTVTHQGIAREYDVMVVLYGWEANLPSVFTPFKKQLCTEQGFVITDAHCRTPLAGIYAIGEITNRMHPCVVTAMAEGVVAAKAIQGELEG